MADNGVKTVAVATGNAHKLTEIETMLGRALPGVRFVSWKAFGDFEDPKETGTTFAENALIKARASVAATGCASVADDSGLVVDALDGEPGVYSARYAGVHGDDAANNEKLLAKVQQRYDFLISTGNNVGEDQVNALRELGLKA